MAAKIHQFIKTINKRKSQRIYNFKKMLEIKIKCCTFEVAE
jgi:hypothetical protein